MIPRRKISIGKEDFKEYFNGKILFSRQKREEVEKFEAAFAEYLGAKHACALSSGRDAIRLGLTAMGVKPGDEILFPAYTLGELVPMLKSIGYKLVPVDVEPDTFNMNVDLLSEKVSDATKAIIVVHILGAPCDIEAVMKFAKGKSLSVLEDCAHGLGATVNSRKVGTFGDASIFSFEVNKAVPTYGGGMLVTDLDEIDAQVRAEIKDRDDSWYSSFARRKAYKTWLEELLIRSPFYGIACRVLFSESMAPVFEKMYRGANPGRKGSVRYSYFQARLGLSRLARLDERNRQCNELWERMKKDLPDCFMLQKRDKHGQPAFYNFVTLSESLATPKLRKALARLGVDVGIGTEVMDDCGTLLGHDDCPVAKKLVEQGVLLPLYEVLTEHEYQRVVRALNAVAGEVKKDEI